jgi:ABC-type multidrug transport system ATPase subunit
MNSMNRTPAVSCRGLNKSYGEVTALRDVSCDVARGELFGIIGPDGAGKTTLFRILTTLVTADSGTATVGDMDVVRDYRQIRTRVGYMPGRFSLYQDLTVEENLNFFASVFGTSVRQNYHLIEDIYKTLEPFRRRRAGNLSGGMKQKLALSCALIHEPDVLFLDEPTTGVDPVSRREFWGMLRRLKERGITILVSTPYMDEATRCDRIALMLHGAFMTIDAPQDIIRRFDGALWAVSAEKMSPLLRDLQVMQGIRSCFAFGSAHHVTIDPAVMTSDALRRQLHDLGHTMIDVRPIDATIEDCFMQLLNDGRA